MMSNRASIAQNMLAVICILLAGSQIGIAAPHDEDVQPNEYDDVLPKVREAFGRGDVEGAYKLAIEYAEAGSSGAQFTVAVMLLNGRGGEFYEIGDRATVERLAANWLRKSAAAGFHEAIEYLADSYLHGWNSLPKNDELSACWRSALELEEQIQDCIALESDFQLR